MENITWIKYSLFFQLFITKFAVFVLSSTFELGSTVGLSIFPGYSMYIMYYGKEVLYFGIIGGI